MNPIETQWHQLKSHEICGRIFDNEYGLAKAVMQGWNLAVSLVNIPLTVLYLIPPSYLYLLDGIIDRRSSI
jgi:hypothetical protein